MKIEITPLFEGKVHLLTLLAKAGGAVVFITSDELAELRTALAAYPGEVPQCEHAWQEFNAYGNTCHFPGCTRTEEEHNGDYGVALEIRSMHTDAAYAAGEPAPVDSSSKDEYTTGYDSNRVREHVDQAGSEAGTRSAGSRPFEGVRPSGVNERSSGIDGRSGLRTRDRDQRPTGMTEPIKPEHADKIEPVTGTEFSIERRLTGYAYPVNGNVHNPTPAYRWNLLLDGRLVDSDARKSPLIEAARKPGAVALYRESAHKADSGVTGCPGGLAHIEGKPCAVVGCTWSAHKPAHKPAYGAGARDE